MKIFVAIPTFDGKLPIETARSLMDEQIAAITTGDSIQTMFLPGCSLIPMARNALAQKFLDSDCDRLVFVDSDISWTMGDLVKLAKTPRDVIGAAYRLKSEPEDYPVSFIVGENGIWGEDGMVEVEYLPTGFLAINKSVLMRLKEAHPGRVYTHQGVTAHCWFESPFSDGQFYGEDVWFCKEWRKLGGKVILQHEITLTHHHGPVPYTGNVGEWLKSGGLKRRNAR